MAGADAAILIALRGWREEFSVPRPIEHRLPDWTMRYKPRSGAHERKRRDPLGTPLGLSPCALAALPWRRRSRPAWPAQPRESATGDGVRAGGVAGGQLPVRLYRRRVQGHLRRRQLLPRGRESGPAQCGTARARLRVASRGRSTARRLPRGRAPHKPAMDRTASRSSALGVRQIKAGQFAQARQNFARSGRGAAADLTSTLLTAWAYRRCQ